MCEGFWEEAELSDNYCLQFGPPLQGRVFYNKPLKQTSIVFLKGIGNRKEVIFFLPPSNFASSFMIGT